MKNSMLLLSIVFSFCTARAATQIQCGTLNKVQDQMEVVNFEFSSEYDDFTGIVGKSWQMYINGKPVKKSKSITALEKDHTIRITALINATPKVGNLYEIDLTNADYPTLTKTIIGGVAGGLKKTYACMGMYD